MNSKAPDAFRTISEVADWLGVNAHVLRFWESKFSQVKPVKRAGGRRYYRRADMELLGGIQKLLHEDGMTIKGVQKVLREQGLRSVSAMSKPVNDESTSPAPQVESTSAPEVAQTNDSPQNTLTDAPIEEPVPTAQEPAPPAPDIVEERPEPVASPVIAPVSEPIVAEAETPKVPSDVQPLSAPAVEVSDFSEPDESQAAPEEADGPEPEGEPEGGSEMAEPAGEAPVVMPLFTHREPLEEVESDISEPAPEAKEPEQDDVLPIVEEPASGPIIAPLPGPELTVAEALARLAPLQVDPALLRPIHARLVALRDRMDATG